MKSIILIILLLLPTLVLAVDEYDNKYCKDPVELQKWANMLEKSPDSDMVAGFHALWLGLCVKVEAHTLTVERAQTIFENFKWGIIESIKSQEEKPDKEAT
jgi:hypothetical protein